MQQLIEQIHAAGRPMVIAVTGGGSGAISSLLAVPGASATVLEAVVPYSPAALANWLGGAPDHYCSERTARAMAMAALERARTLTDVDPLRLYGIGATASLASNRPKRGPHRIHVAWQSAEVTDVVSCELEKDARMRAEEEGVAASLILNAIARACGLAEALPVLAVGDTLSHREQRATKQWSELLLGQRACVRSNELQTGNTLALFPGAFNPIHTAHRQMAEIAASRLGRPVFFELSITNVDKPPLDFIEIADRLQQFDKQNVLLTRAPKFVEKARLAPGCTFVVGLDTIERIGDTKYYPGGTSERDAALAEIAGAGCRFLVFGRGGKGEFRTLAQLNLPTALSAICDEVPESVFRADISSTEIRGV
jgi:nicotinamide mononucleotide (NMN) deamidase PncC